MQIGEISGFIDLKTDSVEGTILVPCSLITNESIRVVEDAWRFVLAYNRRWQVEVCIR